MAIDDSGRIFVLDPLAGTNGLGALFGVDATTGQRTLISDFGDPNKGALGFDPNHLAIDNSGNILVSNLDVGTGQVLFSIDPTSGQRTVISDFADPSQGPLGLAPRGIAVVPEPLTCDGKIVTIKGTPGNDILHGTNGDDVIHGLGGHDIISAGDGDDTVCGGDGRDIISGGNGRDRLFGNGGDDVLIGGDGNDRLFGGFQNDVLIGGNGNDSLNGGRDNDVCSGGSGTDSATNCETVGGVP